MEYVHFLNIEYLLLRVYDIFYTNPVIQGGYGSITSPLATTLHVVAIILGNLALVGMFVTLILFALIIYVRIRIVMVEHHGFEEKEEEEHGAVAHAEETPTGPKNPRWERVRELASGAGESDWRLAILEADIMLGDLLRDQGYRGQGVGRAAARRQPAPVLDARSGLAGAQGAQRYRSRGGRFSSFAARSKRDHRPLPQSI